MKFFGKRKIKKRILLNKYFAIIKESFIVLIVEYLMLGAMVLASFIINENYGVEALGVYALVLASAQIVVVGVSLPFSSLIRRDLSVKGIESAGKYIADVNFFRVANILIVILCTFTVMPFFSPNLDGIKLFLVLMLLTKGIEILNDTYFVTYQALSNYKLYASLKIGYATLIWGGLILIYFNQYPITVFYYLQMGIALLFLLFNFFLFRNKFSFNKSAHFNGEFFNNNRKYLLKEAWPMIVNSLVSQGSAKLNAIIIFHFIGTKDLGVFSVLIMFSNIFAGVGNSIGIVTIGKFTLLIKESVSRFTIFLRKFIFLFLLLGFLMSFLYYIILPFLLQFYHFDVPGLNRINIIIGLAIPFLFVTSCISNIFLILQKQIAGVYVSILIFFISILVYVGFSYSMGLSGAGYAYFIMAFLQLAFILIWAFVILKKAKN